MNVCVCVFLSVISYSLSEQHIASLIVSMYVVYVCGIHTISIKQAMKTQRPHAKSVHQQFFVSTHTFVIGFLVLFLSLSFLFLLFFLCTIPILTHSLTYYTHFYSIYTHIQKQSEKYAEKERGKESYSYAHVIDAHTIAEVIDSFLNIFNSFL